MKEHTHYQIKCWNCALFVQQILFSLKISRWTPPWERERPTRSNSYIWMPVTSCCSFHCCHPTTALNVKFQNMSICHIASSVIGQFKMKPLKTGCECYKILSGTPESFQGPQGVCGHAFVDPRPSRSQIHWVAFIILPKLFDVWSGKCEQTRNLAEPRNAVFYGQYFITLLLFCIRGPIGGVWKLEMNWIGKVI
jgi:hypothetical protein